MVVGGMLSGIAGGATVAIVIKAVDQYSGAIKGADTKLKMLSVSAKAAGVAIAGIGVGLLALSVSSVKTAIEFEETASKFATIFRSVSSESEAMAKNLEDNFGLSRLASRKLLSDTGDLLTGFGFTGAEALNMANQVNELAVDLASFSNVEGGAERASQALTKALLGERESLKSLSIAITEADISQKAYEMGMLQMNESGKGFTGMLTRQQKAQLTLMIAIDQSKNAIGDWAKTSDSAANRVRQLQSDFENLKTEMGTELLPTFEALTGTLLDNSDTLVATGKSIGTFVNTVAVSVLEVIKYLELLGATIGTVGRIVATDATFSKDFGPSMTRAVDDIFGGGSAIDNILGKNGAGIDYGPGGGPTNLGGGGLGGGGTGGGLGGGTGGRTGGGKNISVEENDVMRELLEAKRSNVTLEKDLLEQLDNGTLTQEEYTEAMTESETKVSQLTIAAVNFGYEMEYLNTVMDKVAVSARLAANAENNRANISLGGSSESGFALTGAAALSKHNELFRMKAKEAEYESRDKTLGFGDSGERIKRGSYNPNADKNQSDYGDSLSYVNEHGVKVNQVATGTKDGKIVMNFYNQVNTEAVMQDIGEAAAGAL